MARFIFVALLSMVTTLGGSFAGEPIRDAAETPSAPQGRILAAAEGVCGVVTVEAIDGMRYLKINGVVQAAVAEQGDLVRQMDPLVEIVSRIRPGGRALVIGLGSGRTARLLEQSGFRVEAVEIEPAVVEFARTFFGYQGHAAVADGLDYVQRTEPGFDVVLLDAFDGIDLPEHLATREALKDIRRVLRDDRGVIAIRLLGAPDDLDLYKTLDQAGLSQQALFASGLGSEIQNLYLLASAGTSLDAQPLAADVGAALGLPLRRIPLAGQELPDDEVIPVAGDDVTVVGYLIQATENGEICLDLPHWEMGAMRYVLSGPLAEELGGLLSPKWQYPTEGDIRSDGDTAKTLKSMLGGGGSKRSDVRFSPVIAAVRGKATLRIVINPNQVFGGKPMNFGPEGALDESKVKLDPLLPYGGALYDMEVVEIVKALTFDQWSKLQKKKFAPLVKKVSKAISRAKLSMAAEVLTRYLEVFDEELGSVGRSMLGRSEIAGLIEAVTAEKDSMTAKSPPFDKATACDRVRIRFVRKYSSTPVSRNAVDVMMALWDCAESGYKKVVGSKKHPQRELAAARLMDLYEQMIYFHILSEKKSTEFDKKAQKLKKAFPDLDPFIDPPGLPTEIP